MSIIERLEQLDREATEGPWSPTSDFPKYAIAAGDRDIVTTDNRLYRTSDKKHGTSLENAQLIAEMRNALPEIIAVLKAAARVDDFWGEDGPEYLIEANLRLALAALKRKGEG